MKRRNRGAVINPQGQASPSLYTEHDALWYEIFLWPAWFSCPNHSPSQLPVHLLSGRARGIEKSLTFGNHCSATTETPMCYQHCSHTKPKTHTAPATERKMNSVSAETRTRALILKCGNNTSPTKKTLFSLFLSFLQKIMKRLIKRYVLKAQIDKESDEVNEGEYVDALYVSSENQNELKLLHHPKYLIHLTCLQVQDVKLTCC